MLHARADIRLLLANLSSNAVSTEWCFPSRSKLFLPLLPSAGTARNRGADGKRHALGERCRRVEYRSSIAATRGGGRLQDGGYRGIYGS
jgi:hypothetical protein